MQQHQKSASFVLATLPLLLFSTQTFSAGFAIIEHSASGMGTAFAGAAAVGEDASTIWFNPAGMSLLDDRAMVSQAAHIIVPKSNFTNKNSRVNPVLTGGDVNAVELSYNLLIRKSIITHKLRT